MNCRAWWRAHKWSSWSEVRDAGTTYATQYRYCEKCNRAQERYIK